MTLGSFSGSLYSFFGVNPSESFGLIFTFALTWLMVWWLKEDNKLRGRTSEFDMGFIVYLLWPIIIPLYLFKTRGIKAFFSLFKITLMILGTVIFGNILAVVVKVISSTIITG
jgi:hypothetical protein